MADLLDGIRTDINARLTELRPLVDEAAQLERALVALDGTLQTTKRTDRAPASPTSGRRRRTATARGQAGQRIIEFIKANPGSTAGDVARALGLKRNSTSTRMTQLARAGALTKDKRGLHGWLIAPRQAERLSPRSEAVVVTISWPSTGPPRTTVACQQPRPDPSVMSLAAPLPLLHGTCCRKGASGSSR